MIDTTALRTRMEGYLQRCDLPVLDPHTVLALLDENAALRAERDEMDKQRRHWLRMHDSALDEAQALESRLAALKAAGEKVVEAHRRVEESPYVDGCVCSEPEWKSFEALLRSDP